MRFLFLLIFCIEIFLFVLSIKNRNKILLKISNRYKEINHFLYLYRSVVPFSNLTEFLDNNSSMPLNETNQNSSPSIFTLLLILIIAGGIFCIYINKSKKSNNIDLTRSSFESRDSITSNESIEIEDN